MERPQVIHRDLLTKFLYCFLCKCNDDPCRNQTWQLVSYMSRQFCGFWTTPKLSKKHQCPVQIGKMKVIFFGEILSEALDEALHLGYRTWSWPKMEFQTSRFSCFSIVFLFQTRMSRVQNVCCVIILGYWESRFQPPSFSMDNMITDSMAITGYCWWYSHIISNRFSL